MVCYRLILFLILNASLLAQVGAPASVSTIKNASYCPDTSVSANTITCSTVVGFVGYSIGQSVDILLANSVTGATTININGLGAKAVTYNGSSALITGTMISGGTYRLTYDGTEFVLQGNVNSSLGGAQAVTQLIDFAITNTSSTIQTMCALCSSTLPAQTGTGIAQFIMTAPVTATISGTSSSDTVFWYTWGGTLWVGMNGAETITCSAGCSVASGITAFPAGSVKLWATTITANVWNAITPATMDFRSAFSTVNILPGTGISSSTAPTTGFQTLSLIPLSITSLTNAAYCADSSGAANTITCSTNVSFAAYSAGQAVDLRLANSVTGAATININALGAKAVTYNGANAMITGIMYAGATYRLQYDGTRFVLQGSVGSSGGGSGGGITVYSGATALTGTLYFPIGGGLLPSTTESQAGTFAPQSATVSNFAVNISAAPGLGNSVAFTWRDATSSQSVTCTVSGATATSCSDSTHSFTAVAGDLIDIQAVTTGTIAGTPNLIMSAEFGTVGANGTVNSATQYQVGEYLANGTAISGVSIPNCPDSSGNHVNFNSTTGVYTCGTSSGGAMVLISDQLLGTAAATVTFSSIPGTFKHLKLFVNARCSGAVDNDEIYAQYNGDTSAHYTIQNISGNGSTASAGNQTGSATASLFDVPCASTAANYSMSGEASFVDYASTTFNKTAVMTQAAYLTNVGGIYYVSARGYYWSSNAAITSIVFGIAGGSNFVAGSRFTLYGLN